MTEERHARILAWRKATLWVLVVLCIAEFLRKDSVLNSIWLFGTAGVVPGREKPLAPDTVLWILAGVSVCIFLGIVTGIMVRICRTRKAAKAILTPTNETTAKNVEPAPIVATKVVEITPQHTATELTPTAHIPAPPIIIPITRTAKKRSFTPLLRAVVIFLQYLGWFGRVLETCALITGAAIVRFARKVSGHVQRYAVAFGTWSLASARNFIRWLTPHLWRFDAWLEKQTRVTLARTHKKVSKHPKFQEVSFLGRETKQAITRALPSRRPIKD